MVSRIDSPLTTLDWATVNVVTSADSRFAASSKDERVRVDGSVVAESRLEVQSTAVVTGDIRARRMQLEEGAALQGQVLVGERASQSAASPPSSSSLPTSPGQEELV